MSLFKRTAYGPKSLAFAALILCQRFWAATLPLNSGVMLLKRKEMEIREYCEGDWNEVWHILRYVFQAGDTFPNRPDTNEQEAWDYWIEKPRKTFVAVIDDQVVGSYHIKDNQQGLGSHIANAGYVVSPSFRGKGVGISLAQHSIACALDAGYLALQFNLVVSTNNASISLWKKLNFKIIGTLPKAFNHKQKGLVDAYVMFRWLA